MLPCGSVLTCVELRCGVVGHVGRGAGVRAGAPVRLLDMLNSNATCQIPLLCSFVVFLALFCDVLLCLDVRLYLVCFVGLTR